MTAEKPYADEDVEAVAGRIKCRDCGAESGFACRHGEVTRRMGPGDAHHPERWSDAEGVLDVIAARVREPLEAEVARLREELTRERERVYHSYEDIMIERDEARAQLAAVAALHQPNERFLCRTCGWQYPCLTALASRATGRDIKEPSS